VSRTLDMVRPLTQASARDTSVKPQKMTQRPGARTPDYHTGLRSRKHLNNRPTSAEATTASSSLTLGRCKVASKGAPVAFSVSASSTQAVQIRVTKPRQAGECSVEAVTEERPELLQLALAGAALFLAARPLAKNQLFRIAVLSLLIVVFGAVVLLFVLFQRVAVPRNVIAATAVGSLGLWPFLWWATGSVVPSLPAVRDGLLDAWDSTAGFTIISAVAALTLGAAYYIDSARPDTMASLMEYTAQFGCALLVWRTLRDARVSLAAIAALVLHRAIAAWVWPWARTALCTAVMPVRWALRAVGRSPSRREGPAGPPGAIVGLSPVGSPEKPDRGVSGRSPHSPLRQRSHLRSSPRAAAGRAAMQHAGQQGKEPAAPVLEAVPVRVGGEERQGGSVAALATAALASALSSVGAAASDAAGRVGSALRGDGFADSASDGEGSGADMSRMHVPRQRVRSASGQRQSRGGEPYPTSGRAGPRSPQPAAEEAATPVADPASPPRRGKSGRRDARSPASRVRRQPARVVEESPGERHEGRPTRREERERVQSQGACDLVLSGKCLNPRTAKTIKIGGQTYTSLIEAGFRLDPATGNMRQ